LIKIGIGAAVLGLVVGLVLYLTRDKERELPPVLQDLSVAVASEFAEKLPRTRDVNDLLMIVPRRGNPRDEEKRFRTLLKDKITTARKYNVRDWDNVKADLNDTTLGKIFKETGLVPGDDPKNLDEAKKVLKWLAKSNVNFDGVLVINISDFQEGEAGYGAKVACDGAIYSVAAEKEVAKVPTVAEGVDSRLNYIYLHHTIAEVNWFGRFLGWFLVAAGLPFGLIQLVRAVVQKRKNELNMILLAGFTVFDVVLAWTLVSALAVGTGTIVFLVILAAAMGYYNYDAMDYIERRLT
jgi:hypothetical protein